MLSSKSNADNWDDYDTTCKCPKTASQSGIEMDTTWKKEARPAKDDMATDSNGRAKEMGLSWDEAQTSAKDRTLWRKIVVALCPTGDEKDK